MTVIAPCPKCGVNPTPTNLRCTVAATNEGTKIITFTHMAEGCMNTVIAKPEDYKGFEQRPYSDIWRHVVEKEPEPALRVVALNESPAVKEESNVVHLWRPLPNLLEDLRDENPKSTFVVWEDNKGMFHVWHTKASYQTVNYASTTLRLFADRLVEESFIEEE